MLQVHGLSWPLATIASHKARGNRLFQVSISSRQFIIHPIEANRDDGQRLFQLSLVDQFNGGGRRFLWFSPQQIITDKRSEGSLCRHKIPNRTPLAS